MGGCAIKGLFFGCMIGCSSSLAIIVSRNFYGLFIAVLLSYSGDQYEENLNKTATVLNITQSKKDNPITGEQRI